MTVQSCKAQQCNIHAFAALAAENIMKFALLRKTQDNITVIFIALDPLKQALLDGKSFNRTSRDAGGWGSKVKFITQGENQ